ncbi:unnamed protein product [Enterobius vermicularis]|uniref:Piwi domain-containing protein n=1 Tax=Enterobius vermicularis TaxID=51028 RepID=A0A3P6GYX3_ENTVE|nr:unnamed protein product [Enterobius vermicularis]
MQLQPILPAKTAYGQRTTGNIRILTNLYGIIPTKNTPFYRYDFRVLEEYPPKQKGGEPVLKQVTKQTKEDYTSIERKNKCVAVYIRLLDQQYEFFGEISSFVYDRASILYSLDKLKIADGETKSFIVDPNDLPSDMFPENCTRILVYVKQCSQDFQLTSTNLQSGYNLNPNLVNQSLLQFYELLLSQEAFFTDGRFVSYGSGESYLYNPSEFGFEDDEVPLLPDGKYIGVGASKVVKVLEGPHRNPIMSVNVDVKKAAFHIELQCVAEKVADICGCRVGARIDSHQIKLLSRMLRGLYVRCNYGQYKVFCISEFAEQSADTMRIKRGGQMISLVQYFQEKYDVNLRFVKLPLAVEKTSKGISHYPIELLFICENQRVTLPQESSKQVEETVKASATLPRARIQQTLNMMRALKLDNGGRGNRWCREFQLQLSEKSLEVEARVLHKPTVFYGNNGDVVMKDSGSWSIAENTIYIIPSSCKRWMPVALVSATDRFTKKDLEQYVKWFLKRCHSRGISIAYPEEVSYFPRAREPDVETAFKIGQREAVKFIHFVTSETLRFHERIKFFESQYQILTQDVLTKTAALVHRRSQTLDNIVHKTNLKLGGLNFDLRLESQEYVSCCTSLYVVPSTNVDSFRAQKWISRRDRLIIGIDLTTTNTTAKNDPSQNLSVYGLCLGETAIRDLAVESLKLAKKYRGVPRHLVIVRDGISEGQYKYVLEKEVQQVKDACITAGGRNYRPHITFVVVTKRHHLRLYRSQIDFRGRASEQNIPPGTVVDHSIVSPIYNEFYLNSYVPLQGTTKASKYNVLFDTSNISPDEVQGMMYALTFNLQTTNQPCSVPAPVMMANQMAARGRSNFTIFFGQAPEDCEELDLDRINLQLGYMGKELAECRFNA